MALHAAYAMPGTDSARPYRLGTDVAKCGHQTWGSELKSKRESASEEEGVGGEALREALREQEQYSIFRAHALLTLGAAHREWSPERTEQELRAR